MGITKQFLLKKGPTEKPLFTGQRLQQLNITQQTNQMGNQPTTPTSFTAEQINKTHPFSGKKWHKKKKKNHH